MPRNILVRLTGDNDEAKAEIDEVAEKLDDLGEKKPTATIHVDTEQAQKNLDELLAELEAMPREETIHLRIATEQAKLDAFVAKLEALKATAAETPVGEDLGAGLTRNLGSVSRQIDASRSRIESLVSDLGRLGDDGEKDVSRLTQRFTGWASSITNARGKLSGLLGDVLGKIPLIGGLFDGVVSNVGKLVESLLPGAAEGFSGLVTAGLSMAAMVPILGLIVAAVSALVVSLGEALLGVVALGVAFLAALAPIIAVLGIVLVKIKDIVTGQAQMASASANLKSAYESQKQAVTELAQAEANEGRQRLLAIQAQIQAYNALKDAENQTADAKLGVTSAQLSLQQARLTLAAFKQELAGMGNAPGDLVAGAQNVSVEGNFGQTQAGASGLSYQEMLIQYKEDLLAVKQAAQGIPDALQQVADATANQATAAANYNLYVKEGLKAYPDYQSALDAVATSQENVARAADQVAAATLAQQPAIKHGASDATGFMAVWDKLKKTLGAVFGPAEQAVFKGIETALGILATKLKPLMPSFLLLGKAIGAAFVHWARFLTSKGSMRDIETLIRNAAKLTKAWAPGMDALFDIIVKVANDAMPILIGIVKDLTGKFIDAAKHPRQIREFIAQCIDSTRSWWHVIEKVASAFLKLAGFMQTLLPLVKAVALPFEKIESAVGSIEAISKANQQAQQQGNIAYQKSEALITKDQGLLKDNSITAKFRQFLQLQIRNLRSQLPSIKANMPGGSENSQSSGWYNILKAFLPLHATGGIAMSGQAGIFGESGPEALVPLAGAGAQVVAQALSRYFVADLTGLMRGMPSTHATVAGLSPASGGQVHHHDWHLNQGDTIADDQHFVAVVERRLSSLGGGVR